MATSSSGVLESRGRNREVVDSIFRVGSLNVGTLTGKFLELVDGLKKRHVDAVCVQETKWKGDKIKETNGFKLWYSGVVTNRNGVGIMLHTQLRNNMVELNRFNDRVMMIKVIVDVVVVNIVSAYLHMLGERVRLSREQIGLEQRSFVEDDVNQIWNYLASLIRGVAKNMLGITSGKIHDQREAWWWNEDVQERVKAKQARLKEIICCNKKEKFDTKKTLYKEAKRLSKRAVVEAKDKAYEEIHTMKLWERVIEIRLRRKVTVSENQFSFMLGRSKTEAIHLLRRLIEKYRERMRDLHMVFIDLENAYDSVPRSIIWTSLESKGVSRIYVRAIQAMYSQVMTCFRTPVGDTQYFSVKIGIHQGSSLSPFLFAIIMDVPTRGIPDVVPWCMLFADDMVIINETKSEINEKLEQWRVTLETSGLHVSHSKTEYMWCNFNNEPEEEGVDVRIGEHLLVPKESFKYLGSKDGKIDADVTHRIQSEWLK
ncbi:uncharacterized protein LOC141686476 [Apium graveolens]|uniref:uncharacterized protein LOC141686476 n=1 Tax=Apium graveolens TaxID=4045 RepID=UPI003D7A333E